MLKKKSEPGSRSMKASSSSPEHRESMKRSKFYFPRAFRSKATEENARTSSTDASSIQPSVTPSTPPSASPTVLVSNAHALSSSSFPITPANNLPSSMVAPESFECSAETLASSSSISQDVSANASNSLAASELSVAEEPKDSVNVKKLSPAGKGAVPRKLNTTERPTVRFSGIIDDLPKTTFFSTPPVGRPRSMFHSKDALSMENLDTSSDSDDDVAQNLPKTRKGSLPSIYDQSNFTRANQETARKTAPPIRRSPMKNESSFTVKYVRVHGPEDGAYKNNSRPRGLIFMKNFEEFDDSKYTFRHGSSTDYANLLELFQQMGYRRSQKYCESGFITRKKFLSDLQAFSKLDHNMYDSCIIILMSHGVRDKTFVCSDGEHVDLMEVYSMLNNTNCHHLSCKPKIFILQFCRPQSTLPKTQSPYTLRHPSFGCTPSENELIDFRIKCALEPIVEQLRTEIRAMFEANGFSPAIKASTSKNEIEDGEGSAFIDVSLPSPEHTSTPNVTSVRPYAQRFSATMNGSFGSPYPVSAASANVSDVFTFDHHHLMTDAAKLDSNDDDCPTPHYSDMYSIFSTNSGGVAYRHPRKGSLLVQAICQVFSSHAYQDDIEELVRKVSKWMQQEIAKDDPVAITPNTVVERVNNGLDKAFYFNPTVLRNVKRNITSCW